MCTNYLLAVKEREDLARYFGAIISNWLNPEPGKSDSFEFYPGYEAPVIHAGSRVLARYRWGFDNFMDTNRPLVNAKGETVAELRTFKKAFGSTRCLVPANGFYDYRGSDPKGAKTRYLFRTDDELFAFAGLWQEQGGVRTFTIITTEPNDVVREYHHRMPVILPRSAYDRWLDPKASQVDLQNFLRPWEGKLIATVTPKSASPKAAKPAKEPKSKKMKSAGGNLFD